MILVFGRTGQIARELARIAPAARFLGRDEADLADPDACAAAIARAAPAAVINAAAYTAVDRAEDEEPLARIVNADAPGRMAQACAAQAIPFVHLSTDYVFAGEGDAPHAVDAPAGPRNAYGRTKLAGEDAVRAAGGAHAILRTSWVFSAHGTNFVKTMLRHARTRDALRVVADQVGGPTPVGAIARACVTAADALRGDPALAGTYHLAGAPDVSWADFARAIMATAGRDVAVEDIATAAYPTPARRPANSRLDCSGLAPLGIERPDWRAALPDVVAALEPAA